MVGGDGRVQCATNNNYVGLDLGDRAYLKQARDNRDFVLSDFLLREATNTPIVMAAYPVAAINREIDAVILAGVSLDWMAKIMGNLGGRPGFSAVLIDSTGTVLAAPAGRGQHDRTSARRYPAVVGDCRAGADLGRAAGRAFVHRGRRLETGRSALRALPERSRA